MRIESHQVQAGAARSKTELAYTSVSHSDGLVLKNGMTPLGGRVSLTMSDEARQALETLRRNFRSTGAGANGAAPVEGAGDLPRTREELKLQLLEQFMSRVSGRRTSLSLRGSAGTATSFSPWPPFASRFPRRWAPGSPPPTWHTRASGWPTTPGAW